MLSTRPGDLDPFQVNVTVTQNEPEGAKKGISDKGYINEDKRCDDPVAAKKKI